MKKLFLPLLLLCAAGCQSSTQPTNNTTTTGSGLTFHSAIFDVNVNDTTITHSHHSTTVSGQTTTTDTTVGGVSTTTRFLDTLLFNPTIVLS